MSNEELVVLIQQGRADLYAELWEQVKAFVALRAAAFYFATEGRGGVEIDDLIQSGYLALVEAVPLYDPSRECRFLTILNYRLKAAFAVAAGIKTSKRDMLDYCAELDAPVGADDSDGTLLDFIPDPRDLMSSAEEAIYRQQLHDVLEKAISTLPDKEASTLRRYFWDGLTLDEIGGELGASREYARQLKERGLLTLKRQKHDNGLDQFVESRINYYSGTSGGAFRISGSSSTEKKALRRMDLQERYKHLFADD